VPNQDDFNLSHTFTRSGEWGSPKRGRDETCTC